MPSACLAPTCVCSNRASFSQRHLLVSDMETAGRLYKADVASLAADPQDKRSLERFSHPFALLLHLFKAAAESGKQGNGRAVGLRVGLGAEEGSCSAGPVLG